MTKKDFALIQQQLTEIGITNSINKIGKLKRKRYQVVIDFEIRKVFKSRISAKKFIIKQHKHFFNQ